MASQFYVRRQKKVIGPVAGIKLKQEVAAGTVLPTDQVSDSPDGPWHFVADVPPLNSPPTTESDPVEGQLPQQQGLNQEEEAKHQRMEEEAWQSVEREWVAFPDEEAANTLPPVTSSFSSGRSRAVSPREDPLPEQRKIKPQTKRTKYSHSGAVPLASLLITLGGSLLASIALAFIYTAFVIFVPIAWLNIIATFIFGMGIGSAVGGMAKLTHVRNNAFVLGTALLSCVIGIYVEWSVTSMIIFDTPFASSFDLRTVLAAIESLYQTGSWRVGSSAVSGIELVIVWVFEIGCIISFAWFSVNLFGTKQPYCEYCNTWTETTEGVNYLCLPPDRLTKKTIKRGTIELLDSLTNILPTSTLHLRIDISVCKHCDRSNYLTVQKSKTTIADDWTSDESLSALALNIRIENNEIDFFSNCGQDDTTEGPVLECPYCGEMLVVDVNNPKGQDVYHCFECLRLFKMNWVSGDISYQKNATPRTARR